MRATLNRTPEEHREFWTERGARKLARELEKIGSWDQEARLVTWTEVDVIITPWTLGRPWSVRWAHACLVLP